MAIYGTSTNGKQIIISEQLTESSITRLILSLFTLILGFYVEYRVSKLFYQLWSQRKRSFIMTTLFCAYFLSVFFHTIHYMDNIVRPVNYFELKWIYKEYLISTMEIKFMTNFPILIMGYICVKQLLSSMVSGEKQKINRYCLYFLVYILGSLLTLSHYLIEPPFSYQLIPNLTICGEAVMAFCLTLVIVKIYCLNRNDMFGGPEKDLAQLLANNHCSEDEEITIFNEDDIRKVRNK